MFLENYSITELPEPAFHRTIHGPPRKVGEGSVPTERISFLLPCKQVRPRKTELFARRC